nr:DUF5312 domain-containing protein [Treponemataceae bacterium]
EDMNQSAMNTDCASWTEKSVSQISIIRSFITSVPLKKICRLSMNSSIWEADKPEGAEDWFVKYKNQWKKMFDKTWEFWLAERNRYKTGEKLKRTFKTKGLPMIENRPWATTWDGIEFSKEYTLGYLYAFFKKIYPKYSQFFKTIVGEGEFIYRENQNEFTESYNMLNHIDQGLTALNNSLGPKGSYGDTFATVQSVQARTIQNYSKINSLMQTIEIEVQNFIVQFQTASLSMYKILNGFISPNKATHYESLGNINTIMGNMNENFKDLLQEAKDDFSEASNMIKEVELLTVKKAD